ncbi:MAG: type III-B CRISPR module RAMP protein Cmr1 [Deltaproteobacteria bacterium]|nr:type III-B CRISPR module RAMP protein Cmr1 [Deltaproteobacteria bacterium]
MKYSLKAQSDIWTGNASGSDDYLCWTGMKGSLRWWYEALIRGLNGYACDPTSREKGDRCEFDTKSYKKTKDLDSELMKICPACRLFGCTGWSSKIRLKITDDKQIILNKRISKDDLFRIDLIPIKNIDDAEKTLLAMAVRIMVEYGSVGGKTVFKPSEKDEKQKKPNHRDYGLLQWAENPDPAASAAAIGKYNLKCTGKEHGDNNPEWPDFKYFWFVRGTYIDRLTHNDLVGRDTYNSKNYLTNASPEQEWLGGDLGSNSKKAISKKIFSFHSANRCWGYTKRNKNMFDTLIAELAGKGFKSIEKGEDILNAL